MSAHTPTSEPTILLALGSIALIVSGIHPTDRVTWVMEIFPILIIAPLLLVTAKRFPLTALLMRLIFLHALVLMLGGHYTYAQTPVGAWLQDFFHLARNPYDRIGHLFQGFVPAIATREILLRTTALRRGALLGFLTICVCLAFSAFYELIEWWSALALGQGADAFLGTQGDPWDTQWDMFCALIGASAALTLLSGNHDRQLRRLASPLY
jgi:putative membrane protein